MVVRCFREGGGGFSTSGTAGGGLELSTACRQADFHPWEAIGALFWGHLRNVWEQLRKGEQARKNGIFRLYDAPRLRHAGPATLILDVWIGGGGQAHYPQVFHRGVGGTPEMARTVEALVWAF
jgi:hypothetical protein